MKLVFLSGPLAGDEVEVTSEVVLGREGTDLEIEDSAVSRQHARFRVADDALEVTDLSSTNGTYVNSERITETHRLEPGDFVTLGGTTLEVRGDWRSAETEVIAVSTPKDDQHDVEEYVPTSPISTSPHPRPADLRPLLIGAGAVGLILVIGIWFAMRGSNGFAEEVDAICRGARTDVTADAIRGERLGTLKPAARRLLQTRAAVREDLAALEPEPDVAPRFGDFLTRYAATNSAVRRLSTLERKAKPSQTRQVVATIRSSAGKETAIAEDLGLEVCGGLPI